MHRRRARMEMATWKVVAWIAISIVPFVLADGGHSAAANYKLPPDIYDDIPAGLDTPLKDLVKQGQPLSAGNPSMQEQQSPGGGTLINRVVSPNRNTIYAPGNEVLVTWISTTQENVNSQEAPKVPSESISTEDEATGAASEATWKGRALQAEKRQQAHDSAAFHESPIRLHSLRLITPWTGKIGNALKSLRKQQQHKSSSILAKHEINTSNNSDHQQSASLEFWNTVQTQLESEEGYPITQGIDGSMISTATGGQVSWKIGQEWPIEGEFEVWIHAQGSPAHVAKSPSFWILQDRAYRENHHQQAGHGSSSPGGGSGLVGDEQWDEDDVVERRKGLGVFLGLMSTVVVSAVISACCVVPYFRRRWALDPLDISHLEQAAAKDEGYQQQKYQQEHQQPQPQPQQEQEQHASKSKLVAVGMEKDSKWDSHTPGPSGCTVSPPQSLMCRLSSDSSVDELDERQGHLSFLAEQGVVKEESLKIILAELCSIDPQQLLAPKAVTPVTLATRHVEPEPRASQEASDLQMLDLPTPLGRNLSVSDTSDVATKGSATRHLDVPTDDEEDKAYAHDSTRRPTSEVVSHQQMMRQALDQEQQLLPYSDYEEAEDVGAKQQEHHQPQPSASASVSPIMTRDADVAAKTTATSTTAMTTTTTTTSAFIANPIVVSTTTTTASPVLAVSDKPELPPLLFSSQVSPTISVLTFEQHAVDVTASSVESAPSTLSPASASATGPLRSSAPAFAPVPSPIPTVSPAPQLAPAPAPALAPMPGIASSAAPAQQVSTGNVIPMHQEHLHVAAPISPVEHVEIRARSLSSASPTSPSSSEHHGQYPHPSQGPNSTAANFVSKQTFGPSELPQMAGFSHTPPESHRISTVSQQPMSQGGPMVYQPAVTSGHSQLTPINDIIKELETTPDSPASAQPALLHQDSQRTHASVPESTFSEDTTDLHPPTPPPKDSYTPNATPSAGSHTSTPPADSHTSIPPAGSQTSIPPIAPQTSAQPAVSHTSAPAWPAASTMVNTSMSPPDSNPLGFQHLNLPVQAYQLYQPKPYQPKAKTTQPASGAATTAT
ncbi:hypothetical protein BGZ73_004906, partial [Actinomortierella ambigua]